MACDDGNMDGLTKAMRLITAAAITGKGAWPAGAKESFVFNDGVIVVSMDEDRILKFDVIAGKPMTFDHNLDLL